MKDFFISYNSTDRTWAVWIAWQLEEAGWTTVIQAWDFRPGSNFVLKMQRAAEEAARTIAVLSPDYLTSLYTQPEWATAFGEDPTGEKGMLLPVRIRECELKGNLGKIVHIDLVGKDEVMAEAELLAGVKTERAKPSTEPVFPGTARRSTGAQPPFPGPLPAEPSEPPAPTSKPRWRDSRAVLVIVAALLLPVSLAALWKRYISPSTVITSVEQKDHFLDDQRQWYPADIGWELERKDGRIKGRRLNDDRVGLFVDPIEKRPFCAFRDVTMRFGLLSENGKGAAWILRARDSNNYYLFELVTSKSSHRRNLFNFYRYKNGQRQFIDNQTVGNYIETNNNYFITAVAIGNRFIHTIEVFDDDFGPHCLGDFTDRSSDPFREGGVGFRPVDGMNMLLQQFTVITGAVDTECPCKK